MDYKLSRKAFSSMNQELKQRAHKEFDRLGGEKLLQSYEVLLPEGHLTMGYDYPDSPRELDPEKVKSFIDSLIDKTVQMTEERIVGVIENIHTKHYILKHFKPIENREHFGYRKAQMDIKNSLITNKNDINK